jgi:hypothetical protein
MGSVKSNIGHLEPASGVAGMMKALIAMEQRLYPKTLHLDTLSPHIDFDALNLAPARQAVPLGHGCCTRRVLLRLWWHQRACGDAKRPAGAGAPAPQADALVLSSHCKESLAALAAPTPPA